MPTPKILVLAVTAAVAIMAQTAGVEADSRSGHRHFFNPNRGGEHYDTVMANYNSFGFCAVVPKPYSLKQLSSAISGVLSTPS